MNSEIIIKSKLPSLNQIKSSSEDVCIVFYDQKLKNNISPLFKGAALEIPLVSGENLKTLAQVEKVTAQLLDSLQNQSRSQLLFIAVGGGSVGDFVGFLASVFKRGVRLVHIPTTSLAALDSAHGGKTAVNIGGAKNQLGTFHSATKIIIAKDLLNLQPDKIKQSGMGEFYKTCLLDQQLFQQVDQSKLKGFSLFWKFLEQAIQVKYKYVKKDPLETKGARKALNLGHTFGHVYESYFGLPHGDAVRVGCEHALDFSKKSGFLSQGQHSEALSLMQKLFGKMKPFGRQIPKSSFKALLTKDKKSTGAQMVDFVFLKRVGTPYICSTELDDLIEFAKNLEIVK